MKPEVTVVIPTRNRAAVLRHCLEAIATLRGAPDKREILVVDNGSTDETPRVVAESDLMKAGTTCRYVWEGNLGASHARNRAVREAHGEIICFLDDDSPPDPSWLTELTAVFQDPLVGCAGGPSQLDFQGQSVPWWLRGDMQGLLSGYALPHAVPTEIHRCDHYPLGCNLAVRRELVFDFGFFRTDLDRSGGRVLAAGETELVDQIRRAGWKVLYVPDAKVRHLVPPNRLTMAYTCRIGIGLAESHVILTSDPRWTAVARWFASDTWYALRLFLRFIGSPLRPNCFWFDDLMRFWMVAMRLPIRMRAIWRRLRNPLVVAAPERGGNGLLK